MEIIKGKHSFNLDEFLEKPLFAHLSTSSTEGPRDSPVWVLWKDKCLWIIGTHGDTFPLRIKEEPSCAIGIVDFNPSTGKVLHAGFRGKATVEPFDINLAKHLFTKYLGPNENIWDSRFKDQDPNNVFIRFVPETVVVRNQSYKVDES
ncbi:pyridoxamine 5'-phosphate oxidase family protein [Halobacillus sp. A5]|uniref:pyridoxamine 5'-phosphate oxidase family protein n=1 Tax=Halobacillus sp. A5 TaxID=2880263 RepID=UPI0020A6C68B|nr:pyridoxamine 5'-phosphate oxidase family protein [Halobacillus sp. A5]MCP3028705.1 pyridoxamine 5'-phosphate oxidase family protein [Halobacillus sp. A5]